MKGFFILLIALFSFSTGVSQSDSTLVIGGKKYCIHQIKKGETLFGLSRIYKVPYSLIKDSNPQVGDALSIGDFVRIPCDNVKQKVNSKPVEAVPDEFNGNYIFHVIAAKETVFGLTQEYDVSKEQLYKDNPEIEALGLKVGQTIKILKKDITAEDNVIVERYFKGIKNGDTSLVKVDSNALKDTTIVRLALLLPFQFDKNAKYMEEANEDDLPKLYNKTRVFLEFYEGVTIALDSLKNLGLNVQVFSYDTKADTNEIKKILKKQELKKMDFVIGPAYSKNFKIASETLKKFGIPIIAPFTKSKKIIENNPYAIKVVPSMESHGKALAKYVYETRLDNKVIIVYDKAPQKELALKIQAEILSLSLMQDSGALKKVHIINGIFAPLEALSMDTANTLIVLNNEESFTSRFITRLHSRVAEDYKVTVFGFENWQNFRTMEIDYWERLNIHISSSLDYKYGYSLVDSFAKNYFKKYYTEPSKYAFTGFDITYLFLKGYMKYNNYSHANMVGKYYIGGIREYQFKYSGDQNGIDNIAVNIFKYHDFKFTKVND